MCFEISQQKDFPQRFHLVRTLFLRMMESFMESIHTIILSLSLTDSKVKMQICVFSQNQDEESHLPSNLRLSDR